MKNFFIAILVMFCMTALSGMAVNAAEITLAWDANDPAPDGYVVFVRQIGQEYNYVDRTYQVISPVTQVTVTGLSENITYAFVVRAYIGDQTSRDSNEVVYTIQAPPQQIVIPQRVNGIRIIFE